MRLVSIRLRVKAEMLRYTIKMRKPTAVNAEQQTDWALLEVRIPEKKLKQRMKFWRELNEYAVSERGESARCEFKAVPEELK